MRIAVSYPAISLTKAIAGRHRRPQKRLQTAANPPSTRIRARTIAFVISSHPLPVFSRPQSVSIGGFGISNSAIWRDVRRESRAYGAAQNRPRARKAADLYLKSAIARLSAQVPLITNFADRTIWTGDNLDILRASTPRRLTSST